MTPVRRTSWSCEFGIFPGVCLGNIEFLLMRADIRSSSSASFSSLSSPICSLCMNLASRTTFWFAYTVFWFTFSGFPPRYSSFFISLARFIAFRLSKPEAKKSASGQSSSIPRLCLNVVMRNNWSCFSVSFKVPSRFPCNFSYRRSISSANARYIWARITVPLSVRGYSASADIGIIDCLLIWEKLSALELASLTAGQMADMKDSSERSCALRLRNAKTPGPSLPIPNTTASFTKGSCRIRPSIGSGSTFSPFTSVTRSSRRPRYFQASGILA